MPRPNSSYVLTATCPDVAGIVAAVTCFLARKGGFILESQQHGDADTGRSFLRIRFSAIPPSALPLEALRLGFEAVARRFMMDWAITDAATRPRTLVAVSRFGHCLNDLLHRWQTGALPIKVAGIVSTHEDFRDLVEWHGIPYYHLPITEETKAKQERAFLETVEREASSASCLRAICRCSRMKWRVRSLGAASTFITASCQASKAPNHTIEPARAV